MYEFHFSTELEVSLLSGNDEACISSYVILKETCQNLEVSSCTNLKNYVHSTINYWYDEIKKKLIGLVFNLLLKRPILPILIFLLELENIMKY